MKSKFNEMFLSMDILSKEVKLNVGGKDSVKTKIGACLTILLVMTITAASVFIIRTFLRTDIPQSVNETYHLPSYPKINLKEQKLIPMIFAYLGSNDIILANESTKYMTIFAVKQSWNSHTDSHGEFVDEFNEQIYEFVPCSTLGSEIKTQYEYFQNVTYILNMVDNYGLCIKQDDSMYVQGKGSDDIFDLFSIRIKPCILGDECKPLEDLKNIQFFFAMPETSFNQSNIEKPYSLSLNADTYYSINPNMRQSYTARLKYNKIRDFRGILPSWKERADFYLSFT